MQSVVTGQALLTRVLPPPFNMHGVLFGSSWVKHTLAVRRSDMLPVRTFGFLESACSTGRRAFGCSDTVMANIWRIVYRGSAYILPCRWIDANDHMYVEYLAVDAKQFPLFVDVLGGCTSFCHPPFSLLRWKLQLIRWKVPSTCTEKKMWRK